MSLIKANNANISAYYSVSILVTAAGTPGISKEITQHYGINSIVTTSSINKIPTAKLILLDGNVAQQEFKASQANDFNPGNELTIKIGYGDFEDVLFKGIIVKQRVKQSSDGSTQLCIELKDQAVKMTAARKNRIFTDKTDVDILKEICNDYLGKGIEKVDIPVGGNPDGNQPHREMVQYFCSDWDFLVSRADAIGRLVFVNNGEIKITEPDYNGKPLADLYFGGNIYEFDFELNAIGQYKKVTARSFDPEKREVAEEDVTSAITADQGNLTTSDLSEVLGVEDYPLQHSGLLNNSELKSWAYSKLMRSQLNKIRGTAKIDGWTKVKPGVLIELNQISDKFNGTAFVSGILNQFTAGSGWYTELQTGYDQEWFSECYDNIIHPPASGLLPAVNGLLIGRVISTDNEEENDSNYWVKVLIPMINNDQDGVWARVTGIGSGETKGIYFKPEVGDDVVLGFLDDDPRQPVVLGSLYSHLPPPEKTEESEESSGEIKGFFARNDFSLVFDESTDTVTIQTPEEQKIVLSDKEDSNGGFISIEDAHGNYIRMDKDGITLFSNKDLNLEAKKNINIKGVNVTNDCSGSFEASGTTGATVESSGGNTKIAGTLVMIN